MIYAGTTKTELLNSHLSGVQCEHCQQENVLELQVTCDVFKFGILYPIKWWAWNKKGIIRCNNCAAATTIDDNTPNLPKKVIDYYKKTKIPFRYRLPTLVVFPGLLLIAYFFAFQFFSTLFTVMQPAEKKLPGMWQDDFEVYTIYFFDNKEYTAISYDSILFGKYNLDGEHLSLSLFGHENTLPKRRLEPMSLTDHRSDQYNLMKKSAYHKFQETFRKEKNLWRFRSNTPQTDEELRKKVIDYLNFELEKFKIADEEDLPFVATDVNAPVVFAVNGYQVISRSTLKWQYLFHNEMDWQRANEILLEEFPKEFKIAENEKNLFNQNVRFLKMYIQKVKDSDLKFLDKLQKYEAPQ